jgi:hypothetical protein
MTSKAMGEGERAEAQRLARVRARVLGALVCAVLIIGSAWLFKQSGGRIAPAGAITIVIVYLVALIGFGWRTCRRADEVEIRDNLVALAAAAGFYGLVYPGWYFLWKGGLLPEPSHELMYIAMIAVTTLTYLWAKIRR